ncbi:serine/threonine protein kinase [Colletotrichum truncatum]|uniref:Serine/threonine protein kinase n=1 Tax=Colletotrichum truncatum TaxID=5467 RepID=A0ACC3YFS3_COLTU|nr:serine/threonine protein kinase [Colletotrichum truncatum]KAF6788395.1 serine/threonine protein kinase [Colletotrichum truncatum]
MKPVAPDNIASASGSTPTSQKGCDTGSRTTNDIEEGYHVYHHGGFHPVYIGDVYNDSYEVLNKIGYGAYSTVWLVRNLRKDKDDAHGFLALKVLSAESYGAEKDIFEREILIRLRSGDSTYLGYKHVCHLVDDFEHKGPNGNHICLVFEVFGETLRSFGAWFPESMIPNQVMRRFTIQLLLALDYAHHYKVIHTGISFYFLLYCTLLEVHDSNSRLLSDIQPSNIFVKLRDPTLITTGYLASVPIPQQDRAEERYTPIPSRPLRRHYFRDGDRVDLFDIALGDWGVSSWVDRHLTETIQPVALRAPEVLIKAPWDTAADMWNLGAVVLELFRAVRIFSGAGPPRGEYQLKVHLSEIVHLFGSFPRSLLDRGNQQIVREIFDGQGKVNDGIISADSPVLMSEEFTPGLEQDVRDEFVAFLHLVMKIEPTERPTPEDALRGPWLRALQ